MNIPLSDVIPSVMALICLTGIGLSAYLLLRRELPPRVDNHHDVVAKEYAAAFVGLALALADHEKMATLVCDSVSAGVAIALLIVAWRGLMAYFAAQAVKRRWQHQSATTSGQPIERPSSSPAPGKALGLG